MATSTDPQPDGRARRSARSRESIVRALLELIGEGTLEPTAQQVAERADVGVRTVFRHFSDMETLFATMNERLTAEVSGLFVDRIQAGPVAGRIEGLVERRAAIFRRIEPYRRASAVQSWRSPFLREENDRFVRILRRDLQHWLPEAASLDVECADAIELALSFEAWDRLRMTQRLGPKRAQAALRRIVLGLAVELGANDRIHGLEESPHHGSP